MQNLPPQQPQQQPIPLLALQQQQQMQQEMEYERQKAIATRSFTNKAVHFLRHEASNILT